MVRSITSGPITYVILFDSLAYNIRPTTFRKSSKFIFIGELHDIEDSSWLRVQDGEIFSKRGLKHRSGYSRYSFPVPESCMGVGSGGGGGGEDASLAVERLGGDVPSRFQKEVAQSRCLFLFLGYFGGRLTTCRRFVPPPHSKIRGDALAARVTSLLPPYSTLHTRPSGRGVTHRD